MNNIDLGDVLMGGMGGINFRHGQEFNYSEADIGERRGEDKEVTLGDKRRQVSQAAVGGGAEKTQGEPRRIQEVRRGERLRKEKAVNSAPCSREIGEEEEQQGEGRQCIGTVATGHWLRFVGVRSGESRPEV